MFRAMHVQAPVYVRELLRPHNTSTLSSAGLLFVPRCRRNTKPDGAFDVAAPALWNSLLLDFGSLNTVVLTPLKSS